jgi:hypothetical protein
MLVKGQEGNTELEVGQVYKATKTLINSVWTLSFVPLNDGRVVILDYNRNDEEGYRNKDLMKGDIAEDDKRTALRVNIYDNDRWDPKKVDSFEVANPRHIFDYSGQDHAVEDVKDHPELSKLKTRLGAKQLGLTEMKHVLLFEGWVKKYFEPISMDKFKKLAVGDIVLYGGGQFEITDNNGAVLKLKDVEDEKNVRMVNYNMFNERGAITTQD